MRILCYFTLLVVMALAVAPATAQPYIVPGRRAGGNNCSDCTFWFNGESATSTTAPGTYTLHATKEYSAGDTTGTIGGTPKFVNVTNNITGWSLDIDRAADSTNRYVFNPTAWGNEIPTGSARFGVHIKEVTVAVTGNPTIFRAYDSGVVNAMWMTWIGLDNIQCLREDNNDTGCQVTSTSVFATGNTKYIECRFDIENDTIKVYFNGVEDASTTCSGGTVLDTFSVGSGYTVYLGNEDTNWTIGRFVLDHVIVSNNKDRDLYNLVVTQAKTDYQ